MTNYTEHLHRALESPSGTALTTSDPVKLRAKLYAARSADLNPAFFSLSFVIPPIPGELWIVKESPSGPR